MAVNNAGTHVTHCCGLHGCKYGNIECPVENGEATQAYPCQECGNLAELNEELNRIKEEIDFLEALKVRQQK